ncbi:glycogen synthase [Desulforhopalus singaporensis]|uniref:starch synthase n=1 Tax=Desulforhopalus singaporensis TaxID=91360 RepID=A0A1H0JRH8_9BACT|nr:glycogen/starch synthase [Desulforhopalus singaporensis]SDO46143.1 starch synthase [Desulforhopalus singaporensis]
MDSSVDYTATRYEDIRFTMTRQIRSIWMISREYGELAGAGGIKDMVCQLSRALGAGTARSVSVVIPLYGFIDPEKHGFLPLEDPLAPGKPLCIPINMNQPDRSIREEAGYYYKQDGQVRLYLVDAVRFREKKSIYTYTTEEAQGSEWKKSSAGHHDYFAMNVLHQKASLELMIALGAKVDVIHCHDGHTGLLAALIREKSGYISYFRGTGCLVTIHNAGYGYHQEIADIPYAVSITGLPVRVVESCQLERKFDPLLVAGVYALVNTVSENYARELQETVQDSMTGWLGHELKRRHIVLEGVTNGIDPRSFPPKVFPGVAEKMHFDPADPKDTLSGKKRCKNELVRLTGGSFHRVAGYGRLSGDSDMVLLTYVGRLNEQKGVDILLDALPQLFAATPGVQMLVLGSGWTEIEDRLVGMTTLEAFKGRLCYLRGYDPDLANQIFAAGDFFVLPSRFEPCGLTDFMAQLYGNLPIAHLVGGLVKVIDGKTGIGYDDNSARGLVDAIERALALSDKKKRRMQLRAVQTIHERYTWSKVMHKYLDLYRKSMP